MRNRADIPAGLEGCVIEEAEKKENESNLLHDKYGSKTVESR